MYGEEDGVERRAFRRAEKKYKLYYEDDSNNKKKKKKKKEKKGKAVDLSDVLDFNLISDSYLNAHLLPHDHDIFPLPLPHDHDIFPPPPPVFCLRSRPGFYFIPAALSIEEQCKWIRESLTSFPQPPNRTNHNALYGPLPDLFIAAKQNKVLVEVDSIPNHHILDPECGAHGDAPPPKFHHHHFSSSNSVPASLLLRKLRWTTLGLQFDWSKRNYNISLPHNNIPDALCDLAKKMAAPAMPIGEEFRPEAAIVNYFGLGDTLGGHLDDMEADWSKPIVSMSLGCKAIFLLGGKSRDDPPLAMFLRSGDVVLMAGEARECFHGVPRIFTDEDNAEIETLKPHFLEEEDLLEYITASRININIRQVF